MIVDYSKQIGKKMIIKSNETMIIEVDTILYITCDCGVVDFYTVDGNKYFEINAIKRLEKELFELGFYRINRNIIVNGKYITKISINKQENFIQIADKKFIISQRQIKNVKKWLQN